MLQYYKFKLLRILGLISQEKYQQKTVKYTTAYKAIARSKYFNKKWYLEQNPDVKKEGIDPVLHYLNTGWKEGRNPSGKFSGNAYLEINFDIKKSKINPLVHYEKCGKKEKRFFVAPREE